MAYKGVFIEWKEEWSQLFQRCNWYTFHPLQIEIEDDRSLGGLEFTLIVLGLGFRVRWNHTETDEMKHIMSEAERVRKDYDTAA